MVFLISSILKYLIFIITIPWKMKVVITGNIARNTLIIGKQLEDLLKMSNIKMKSYVLNNPKNEYCRDVPWHVSTDAKI